tara:strand:- start:38 stop:268 length:231 start_codon:yes stop_codon:yes gene_type:complete
MLPPLPVALGGVRTLMHHKLPEGQSKIMFENTLSSEVFQGTFCVLIQPSNIHHQVGWVESHRMLPITIREECTVVI